MTAMPDKKRPKTLDDIVFEHRNKGYGSYFIRHTYRRRLLFSFALILSAFLVTTFIYYFVVINPLNEDFDRFENSFTEVVEYNPEMIPIIIQLPPIPKIKNVPLVIANDQNKILEQYLQNSVKPEVSLVKLKPVLPLMDTMHKQLAEDLLKRHKDYVAKEQESLTDTITIILEKAPQFPGGTVGIQTYFNKNRHYPVNALLKGIQGSTIVSFVVNEKGMIENAQVVSGINPELDMEAIRLIRSMPMWLPAVYKGKPISCMLVMPVDFTIR
jgi:TonB family protein